MWRENSRWYPMRSPRLRNFPVQIRLRTTERSLFPEQAIRPLWYLRGEGALIVQIYLAQKAVWIWKFFKLFVLVIIISINYSDYYIIHCISQYIYLLIFKIHIYMLRQVQTKLGRMHDYIIYIWMQCISIALIGIKKDRIFVDANLSSYFRDYSHSLTRSFIRWFRFEFHL